MSSFIWTDSAVLPPLDKVLAERSEGWPSLRMSTASGEAYGCEAEEGESNLRGGDLRPFSLLLRLGKAMNEGSAGMATTLTR